MASYTLSRRRIKPGMVDRYIQLLHQLTLIWRAAVPSYSLSHLVTNIEDPHDVVGLIRWASQADFLRAYHSTPPNLMTALTSMVEVGLGQWEWYDVVREVEVLPGRPNVIELARFVVPPQQHAATAQWMLEAQDLMIDRPGVRALRILQSVTISGLLVAVGEFEDEAHYRAFLDEALSRFSPLPGEPERFSGSLSYSWRRAEAE